MVPGNSLPRTVQCEHLLDRGVCGWAGGGWGWGWSGGEQISAWVLNPDQQSTWLLDIWGWGLDSSVHFSADHFYL